MKKLLSWFKSLSILGKVTTVIGVLFVVSLFGAISGATFRTIISSSEDAKTEVTQDAEPKGEAPKEELGYEIATCIEVIDGDMIKVEIDGETYKVRYIGIDTPELHHPSKPVEKYAQEAYEFNKGLVDGKELRLIKDISETDKYSRLLRYVYVGDLFVNAELVKQGYAYALSYPPDVAHSDEFVELQAQAREAGLGLWAPEIAEEPKEEEKKELTVYITRTGECYHSAGCGYLSRSCIPIDLDDAKARGYRP